MPRLSFVFGALIGLTALSTSIYAQADIPELILEETEGGYIIVNWEDTRTEDEEAMPEEMIEVEQVPEEIPEEVFLEEPQEAQEGAEEAQEGAEEAEPVDNSGGSQNNGGGKKPCVRRRALRQQHY